MGVTSPVAVTAVRAKALKEANDRYDRAVRDLESAQMAVQNAKQLFEESLATVQNMDAAKLYQEFAELLSERVVDQIARARREPEADH